MVSGYKLGFEPQEVYVCHFDNTPDVVDLLESTKNAAGGFKRLGHQDKNKRDEGTATSNDDWQGTSNLSEYMDYLKCDTSSPYVQKSLAFLRQEAKKSKVNWQTQDSVRVKRYANTGTTLHYPRIYNGKAHKAFSVRRREMRDTTEGTAHIFIQCAAAFHITGENLSKAGIANYQLACALESAGKSVSVWSYALVRHSFISQDIPLFAVLHHLKRSQESNRVTAFLPICNAGYFRRFVVRIMEYRAHELKTDVTPYYGHVVVDDDTNMAFVQDTSKRFGINLDTVIHGIMPNDYRLHDDESVQKWIDETIESLNN